ncbi:MAG: CDP-alcohol phosphatidyltransferase family protein [Candidatus Binatia bacterium]
MNIPNFLTLLRICAIPLFLILLTDHRYTEALVIFALAGVTDSLDGAIARLTNSRTTLGSYIDPLADKLLLVSSFLILTFLGHIPAWLTILVITRDVIILLGFGVLFMITGRSIVIRPTFIGKASTFFQLLTVTQALVFLHNPAWYFSILWYGALIFAGGATTVSGLQYLGRAFQWLNFQDEEPALDIKRELHTDSHDQRERYSA